VDNAFKNKNTVFNAKMRKNRWDTEGDNKPKKPMQNTLHGLLY
jgi:hypothetical protein